ncbi:MAG: hypothetical protein CHACPFDD_01969 [Phycisphaerae bacterium]|nr:hypothetical protein [Phycisphaerae bacterium]
MESPSGSLSLHAAAERPEPPRRGGLRQAAFRFACVYLVVYSLPFPLTEIPYAQPILTAYQEWWQQLVPWVGKHILQLPTDITIFTNGSGDTTFDYVKVLCFAVLALVVAALWSLIDRRRREHRVLHECVRIYVRFVLAFTMFGYGLVKVIKLQFPSPGLDRLTQPYGDSSPMGLLWTFMGYSTAYCFFAGAMELLGGLLLIPRKTVTLGALVVSAVMSNIVMMNFCFDVPVKLYSLHLLAMAVFLTLPDAGRLWSFFVLDRPVPAAQRRLFQRRWLNVSTGVLKTLIIGLALWQLVSGLLGGGPMGMGAESPLYGLYQVDGFSHETPASQPASGPTTAREPARWRRVAFERYPVMIIRLSDDSRMRYMVAVDEAAATVTLTDMTNRDTPAGVLNYQRDGDGKLLLEGTLRGRALRAVLSRQDPSTFLLMNRGFHWINEYPFNR